MDRSFVFVPEACFCCVYITTWQVFRKCVCVFLFNIHWNKQSFTLNVKFSEATTQIYIVRTIFAICPAHKYSITVQNLSQVNTNSRMFACSEAVHTPKQGKILQMQLTKADGHFKVKESPHPNIRKENSKSSICLCMRRVL